MTVYNYNLEKDIRSIKHKIRDLEEIKPFMSKNKQKTILLKIQNLEKELKKIIK